MEPVAMLPPRMPQMGVQQPHSMSNHPGSMQPMANMMSNTRNPAPTSGPGQGGPMFLNGNFDGKRMRNKTILRKTVDYNTSITNYIENRIWQRDYRDRRAIQPDALYNHLMLPPHCLTDKPVNSVTTKFVRQSTNKIKCPIFCVCWTPEGRRLVTGASSGEFTLWNGMTFNFETILQAHDTSVRAMVWSRSDSWMLTGDFGGYVKYWQTNMNNVKMYQAHKDPVRGLSFCPTDSKYVSCSDDGTVRVWDFLRCHEERILRGHGADVKCVDWHPQKGIIVSGSKDTQQPVKLWDPRTGSSLATIHAHKNTVMDVKWNANGNWVLTASRDHLVKLYDIRNLKEEMQTFRGHKKEATSLSWHPVNESMFSSGGSDGAIMFWLVGQDKELGSIDQGHDNVVWSLAWHPLGHILASGSNDFSTKFWTRNRAGDRMRDQYNLNTLPVGVTDDADYDGDIVANLPGLEQGAADAKSDDPIPGLDFGSEPGSLPQSAAARQQLQQQMLRKKGPTLPKAVPRDFENAWKQVMPLPGMGSQSGPGGPPGGPSGPGGPPGPGGPWPRHPGMRQPHPGFMDEQMMGPGGPGLMRPMMGPRPLLADPRMRGPGGPADDENYDYDGPAGPMMMDGPRGPGPRMMMRPDGPRPLIGEGPRGPMHGPHGMRPNMMRGPGPRPLFGLEVGHGPDEDYENGDGQMIPGLGGAPDEGNMGGPGAIPMRGHRPLLGPRPDGPMGPRQPWDMAGGPRGGPPGGGPRPWGGANSRGGGGMGPHGHWPRGASGPPGRTVKPLFENDMTEGGGEGQLWDENEAQEMWNNAAFEGGGSGNEHFAERGGNGNFSGDGGGSGLLPGDPRRGRGGLSGAPQKREWQGDDDDDATNWSNPASKMPRQEDGLAGSRGRGRGQGQGSARGRSSGRGRRGGIM